MVTVTGRGSSRLEKSKYHFYLYKGSAGYYRPTGFNSISGNVKVEIFLDIISKHMEDQKVIEIVFMDL